MKWSEEIKHDVGTDTSCHLCLNNINALLDEMAPYKKVTKRDSSSA